MTDALPQAPGAEAPPVAPGQPEAVAVAVAASGWGQSFRVFQPRNLASWIFIWYLIAGAIETFRFFRPGAEAVGTATLGGFVLFTLYALPWLILLRSIDRWTKIPGKLVLFAFLWGGLAAPFVIALPGNDALLSLYGKVVSPGFAQDWGAGLAAPFSEELGKGIGILLLLYLAPRIIQSPFDGLITGAFVGLGFQVVEDVLYVVNNSLASFGGNQASSIVQIGLVRGVSGLFSHTLFSAVFGAGLVFFLGTDSTRPRRGAGLGLMLLAMALHGGWDVAGALAGVVGITPFAVMAAIALLGLVTVILVIRRASAGERTWMRTLLAPEVERGTITDAELAALSGTARERRRFVKTATGYRGSKTARHVLDAASDLAQALTISGGAETPNVAFARSEVARVRATA